MKKTAYLIMIIISFSSPVRAIVFDDGKVHNVDYFLTDNNENVVVKTTTTLNLLPGGTIGNALILYDDCIVNIYGGVVENFIYLSDGSLNIEGGDIHGDLSAGYNWGWAGHVTISGGIFSNPYGVDRDITVWKNGVIDIYGGLFTANEIGAHDSGIITVHGNNFNYQYGDIQVSSGVLTGTLDNGDQINCAFNISDAAKIILVPEPATLLLLSFGAVMARRKVVKQTHRISQGGQRPQPNPKFKIRNPKFQSPAYCLYPRRILSRTAEQAG
jgi:hypothetical protein